MLDISHAAIDRAQTQLGDRATQIQWIAADVTANPDLGTFVAIDRRQILPLSPSCDRTGRADEICSAVEILLTIHTKPSLPRQHRGRVRDRSGEE